MKLNQLTLSNFKGATDLVFTPNGGDAQVYGNNGTGKTTIFDGYLWLLFGNDSLGQADFDIKTIGPEGVKHGLNHMVEGQFELDGTSLVLKRVYKETYVQKTGQATSSFTGHTTDYFINSVPVLKKDFDERVSSICNQKKFRLLSDPLYFANQPWEVRRKTLFALIGEVSDAEVIAANESLKELPAILGELSIDEFRKKTGAIQTKINEELKALPTRMDEASRSIVEPKPVSHAYSEAQLRSAIEAAQQRKATVSAGGEVAKLNVTITELEGDLIAIKNRLSSAAVNPDRQVAIDTRRGYEQSITTAKSEQSSFLSEVSRLESEKARLTTQRDKLAAEWKAIKEQEFTGSTCCPACGQDLPESEIESATEKWNEDKANRLAANVEQGKALKSRIDEIDASLAEHQTSISAIEAELTRLAVDRDAVVIPEEGKVEVEKDASYIAKQKEIADLRKQVDALKSDSSTAIAAIDTEIATATTQLRELEAYASAVRQNETAKARVEELTARQKELATEHEKLEGQMFLTDQFIRAKSEYLTDRINARFSLVRFQLFETQVNGAVKEVCNITVNGVPYDSLNHASRINAGLDVINALAEYAGFAPPVFIDGCESITAPLATRGQQIQLVVSAADPALRFVTSGTRELQTSLI